ncbi:uncharacterized protein LOC124170176 [Ischnura elegans]|uniref:uncharacterized protein LOC124170176 n=1 Tax=Ischnura elegans TaxID=197161 RepID=UPI001ED872FC|nr:uncharacterized protein LOC124170176 [Ischnura elegans]
MSTSTKNRSTKKNYKWCFVPNCISTTKRTPEKIFISVPKAQAIRNKWFKAARRDPPDSYLSTIFCCEDHFKMEEDFENFMEYKLMGGNIKLRTKFGTIPRIFDCQSDRKRARKLQPKSSIEKRHRKVVIKDLTLEENVITSSDFDEETGGQEESPYSSHVPSAAGPNCSEIGVQVSLKSPYRSKGINCNMKVPMSDTATSPVKSQKTSTSTSPIKCVQTLREIYTSEDSSESNSCLPTVSDGSSMDSDLECSHEEKRLAITVITKSIQGNSKLYLGIPSDWYGVLKCMPLPERDIHVTLMKIKLNDSFERLGDSFGISKTYACKIFRDSIGHISDHLRQLIYWPPPSSITKCLPIPFRFSFYHVQSIIDCLEIEIEKPSNPVHQTLTWSEYKKGNTLKYLISATPDGFITFISKGFGGRTSDIAVLENSGFMEKVPPNSVVMADRGFKHASKALKTKNCILVRPPSVTSGSFPSAEEVIETKKIASLRIHVERVISRVREFEFLKAHSVIDRSLHRYTDEVMEIVCGLINLQQPIIRQ